MRGVRAAVLLTVLTACCGMVFAGEVERFALWTGMEGWIEEECQGYLVPAVETTDWEGFISEGNRVRGLEKGDRFRYVFDREGRFYLGVILVDDPDGIELLSVSLNGRRIGTVVGDDENGKALYSFEEAMTVKAGDALDFTCMAPVGCYRIYDLAFAKRRILPPKPSFNHIETWSPTAGDVDICWTTTGIVRTGRVEYGTPDSGQESVEAEMDGRNHRIRLRGLNPNAVYQGQIVTAWQGEALISEPFTFRAAPPKAAATIAQEIDLTVLESTDTPRCAWPATMGIPFQRGALAGAGDLELLDPKGNPAALQAVATSYWGDGSVKWATLSFLADSAGAEETEVYRLKARPGDVGNRIDSTPILKFAESSEGWDLRTSWLHFTMGKKGAVFFGRFGFDGNSDGEVSPAELVTGSETAGLVLESEDGQLWTCASPKVVEVEENGPIRAVVSCGGAMQGSGGDEEWRYQVRLTFWQGVPGMAVNATIWNGNEKPVFQRIRRVSFDVPLNVGDVPRGAFHGEALAPVPDGAPMCLFQDADNHYSQSGGAKVKAGERTPGFAAMSHGKGVASVLLRDFWQTYPSALAMDAAGLRVDLLPTLAPDAYTVEDTEGWFFRLYPWFDDGRRLR